MIAPLGELAHAVLDQFGERARLALGRALARHGGCSATMAFLYGEGELARQTIQAGNWVTMGEVVAGGTVTLIEVNIGSGESRERMTHLRGNMAPGDADDDSRVRPRRSETRVRLPAGRRQALY